MKSMPWFRYYSETADDKKFAFLSRELKMPRYSVMGIWSIIECRASQSPMRGFLYITLKKRFSNIDIAADLGIDQKLCDRVLQAFIDMEMLELQDGVYHLKNWEKRQYASDNSTDRVREWRKEHASNVPETLQKSTGNIIDSVSVSVSDSVSKEEEAENHPNIFLLYQGEIGPLTGIISDELKEAEKEYPPEWFPMAFREAVDHNARSWRYIETILKRWKVQGFSSNGKKPGRTAIDANGNEVSV